MTIVGKNESCRWENLAGPFLVPKLLGPMPPPLLIRSRGRGDVAPHDRNGDAVDVNILVGVPRRGGALWGWRRRQGAHEGAWVESGWGVVLRIEAAVHAAVCGVS